MLQLGNKLHAVDGRFCLASVDGFIDLEGSLLEGESEIGPLMVRQIEMPGREDKYFVQDGAYYKFPGGSFLNLESGQFETGVREEGFGKLVRLSHSSLVKFERDKRQYYIDYISPHLVPRIPSSIAMDVGSVFDILIKNKLGRKGNISGYNVEAQSVGRTVYEWYIENGFERLAFDLRAAQGELRMEEELCGFINGIPVIGKPDLCFEIRDGWGLILDWKVNGIMGEGISPNKFHTEHKKVLLRVRNGLAIGQHMMHEVKSEWGDQLGIYAMLLNWENCYGGIDQVYRDRKGKLSIANFRNQICNDNNKNVAARLLECWEYTKGGYAQEAEGDGFGGDSENDDWFRENCR